MTVKLSGPSIRFFEWLIRDIEQKDPAGRGVHNHLISDSGRVYLFLAHASGRLR